MWLKKAFPRPAPSAAPLIKPAMSVTDNTAGTWCDAMEERRKENEGRWA